MGTQKFARTTEVHPTRFAAVTGTAGHQWVKRHPLTFMHRGAVRQDSPARHNGTGCFVPHDERRDAEAVVPQIPTQF